MPRPAKTHPLPDLVLGAIAEADGDTPTIDELAALFHWYDQAAVVAAIEGLQAEELILRMGAVEEDGTEVIVYGLTEAGASRYDTLFADGEMHADGTPRYLHGESAYDAALRHRRSRGDA